ncbi:Tubulin epsilon and delta complex protein 2 [Lemmus lemmus]
MRTGAQAAGSGPGLKDQQMIPSVAPRAAELFTLKEKWTLLQLPVTFRKAVSQNSRLWTQLSTVRTSDSTGDTRDAKNQFLYKLQMVSSWVQPQARCCHSGGSCPEPGEGLYTTETARAGRTADHCWTVSPQGAGTPAAVTELPGIRLVEKPTQASSLFLEP